SDAAADMTNDGAVHMQMRLTDTSSRTGCGRNTRPTPDRPSRWPLAWLWAGAFTVGTDGFIVAGLLPQLARDFHTTPPAAGQLVTVFALFYAAGARVPASLFARVRRDQVLMIGLVGLAATNAAAAAAPSLAGLFVARIAAALAAAVYTPTAAVVAA